MLIRMRNRWLLSLSLVALLAGVPAVAWAETSVTASNDSDGTETKSGDATATNSGNAFVGHQGGGETDVGSSDIESDQATNVQEGDNDLDATQSASTQTGASVGGQVIGAQVDGTLSVDATNRSTDVDAQTGDASSDNDFAAFIGLSAASETAVGADIFSDSATNVQEGDNAGDVTQSSDALSGAAVGGQVLGATSTGGSDIVLANTSEDSDATSGDADESSSSALVVGLSAAGTIEI